MEVLQVPEGIAYKEGPLNPIAPDPKGWTLDKTGLPISPFEVVRGGGRAMHAVDTGFHYAEPGNRFEVETLDAPLVALGARSPIAFTKSQPDLTTGIHSCLYNNAWGTNYIMWYGEDARFRYLLRP